MDPNLNDQANPSDPFQSPVPDPISHQAGSPPPIPTVGEASQPAGQPFHTPHLPKMGIHPHHPANDNFSPANQTQPFKTDGLLSQPVVKVLSPRGIEYVFLTVSLFTAAIGLGSALISLFNGQTNFSVLAFPIACLVVALPVFAFLFLRLKKSELIDPSLRHEASKRRSTQFTQIVSFLVCFFTLIGFISAIFAKLAGDYSGSLTKLILDVLVVEVIAGGLLAYYWRDEHSRR